MDKNYQINNSNGISIMYKIFISSMTTNIFCSVLGLLSGIIVARILQPTERGELALYQFLSALAAIGVTSLPQAVTQLIAGSSSVKGLRRSIFITAIVISLCLGIVTIAAIYILTPFFLSVSDYHLMGKSVFIVSVSIILAVQPLYFAILRGFSEFSVVNKLLILQSLLNVILIIVLWINKNASPLLMCIVSLCIQYLIVFLMHRIISKKLSLEKNGNIAWTFRPIFQSAVNLLWPTLAGMALTMSDRMVLSKIGGIQALGYYAVALAAAAPVAMCVEAISQISFVEISGSSDAGERRRLLISRFRMCQLTILIIIPPCLILMPIMLPIIFGRSYVAAIMPAMLMTLALAVRSLLQQMDFYFRAIKKQWVGLIINLMCIFLLMIMGPILNYHYGLSGFCLGVLLAYGIGLILYITFCVITDEMNLKDILCINQRNRLNFMANKFQKKISSYICGG